VVDTHPRGDEALIVLARYPRAGFVKRRLAAEIGEVPAADLCRAFLSDLHRRLADHPSWTTYWAFEPANSPFAEEIGGADRCFPQEGRNLGERMEAAMGQALRLGHSRAVLIGSDIPHVPLGVLEEAFCKLAEGAELVIGPAEDGGYYLIGARSVPPVFAGIRWGGTDVLRATVSAAHAAGIEPTIVSSCYDVDDRASLERLRADIAERKVEDLPSTQAALGRLPLVR
jgi:rSAM/selenodomain-associated transferase 1